MDNENVGRNTLRLVGELFVPGASQLVSGNIGSGILHNVLAGGAGLALVGSGVAPVLGSLAILGVKLNSYASATTGRNVWDFFGDAMPRRSGEDTRDLSGTTTTGRGRSTTPGGTSS